MTVQLRAPAEPVILDVLALDEWLAAQQEEAIEVARWPALLSEAVSEAIAARHGFATDLRSAIAPWLAEAREDAARTAEEDRHG